MGFSSQNEADRQNSMAHHHSLLSKGEGLTYDFLSSHVLPADTCRREPLTTK
jgi:hypothetical protein